MSRSQKIRLSMLATALLTAAAVLVRTLAVLLDFEPDSGYFVSGSARLIWSNILLVLAIIPGVVPMLSAGSAVRLRVRRISLPHLFATALLTLMFLSMAVYHVSVLFRFIAAPHTLFNVRQVVVSLLAAISAGIAGGSALLDINFNGRLPRARFLLNLCGALFCCAYTMFLYYEQSLPLNAEVKVLDEMAMLAVAVFLLMECRITLDRPMWKVRFLLGYAAFVMTATASIPALLYHFIKGESLFMGTVHPFLLFGFTIYVLAQLLQTEAGKAEPETGFFADLEHLSEEEEEQDDEPEQLTVDSLLDDAATSAPTGTASAPTEDSDVIPEPVSEPDEKKIPEPVTPAQPEPVSPGVLRADRDPASENPLDAIPQVQYTPYTPPASAGRNAVSQQNLSSPDASPVQKPNPLDAIPQVQQPDPLDAIPQVQQPDPLDAIPQVQQPGPLDAIPQVQQPDPLDAIPQVQQPDPLDAIPQVQQPDPLDAIPQVQQPDPLGAIPQVQESSSPKQP